MRVRIKNEIVISWYEISQIRLLSAFCLLGGFSSPAGRTAGRVKDLSWLPKDDWACSVMLYTNWPAVYDMNAEMVPSSGTTLNNFQCFF